MYEILGLRDVDFVANSGDKVSGRNVYVTYDDNNVTGLATDKLFLSNSKFAGVQLAVGDIIDVRYNRYGRVEQIFVEGKSNF